MVLFQKKIFNLFFFGLFIMSLFFSNSTSWAASKTYTGDSKKFGEIRNDLALVYFLRPSIADTSGDWLFSDDQFLSYVRDNTYSFAYVKPGRHLIWLTLDWRTTGYEIEFVPGQVYYIKTGYEISFINEEDGRTLLNKINRYTEAEGDMLEKALKLAKERYPISLRKEQEKGKAIIPQILNTPTPIVPTTQVKISEYSPLKLEFIQNVTSAINQTGDNVWLKVTEDFSINNQICFRKGTLVKALVTWAKSKGAAWKQGLLDIAIPSVTAVDGTPIPVTGQLLLTGGSPSSGKQTVAFLFGFIGASLLTGDTASVAIGQPITVWTKGENWVNPANNFSTENPLVDIPKNSVVLKTNCSDNITFPRSAEENIIFKIQSAQPIIEAKIINLDGIPLPMPCQSFKVESLGNDYKIYFNRWDLLRFFDKENKIVKMVGKLVDGTAFVTEIELRIKK